MRTAIVTSLRRKAAKLLSNVQHDREPISQRSLSIIESIARGEMAIAEGRLVPHAQAKQRMARWLK